MDDTYLMDHRICAETTKISLQHLGDSFPDYKNDPTFIEHLKLYGGIRTSHVLMHSGSHFLVKG